MDGIDHQIELLIRLSHDKNPISPSHFITFLHIYVCVRVHIYVRVCVYKYVSDAKSLYLFCILNSKYTVTCKIVERFQILPKVSN